MKHKCLMTASTLSHFAHFHLPYIKAFYDMGWEIHVAGAGPKPEIPHAVEVHSLYFRKSYFSLSNYSVVAGLRRIMRRNNYDLIICHTSLAAFFTRLAAVGIKGESRIINVVHGYLFDDDTPPFKSLILKSAEYIMAPVTDLVLTMNEWDYKWAHGHKVASKVVFIPGMGLERRKVDKDYRLFELREKDGALVLVYAAEFSKRKNQAMLIRAMKLLPDNVKLILPGNGSLLEECKSLAQQLGLASRVVFPGYVRNIFSLLKYADVAVTSSRSEGLPFNVLEAMACGLPVIASAVKGNSDLVHHGVNGLVYPYDNEHAFASCVKELMTDRAFRKTLGEKGADMVEKYMLENVQSVLMAEYMSVCDWTLSPMNE